MTERVFNAIAADTRLRFWGARPSRVLVLLSRQHALLRTKGTQEKFVAARRPHTGGQAVTHTRDAYAPQSAFDAKQISKLSSPLQQCVGE